jgi:hypothetical protein
MPPDKSLALKRNHHRGAHAQYLCSIHSLAAFRPSLPPAGQNKKQKQKPQTVVRMRCHLGPKASTCAHSHSQSQRLLSKHTPHQRRVSRSSASCCWKSGMRCMMGAASVKRALRSTSFSSSLNPSATPPTSFQIVRPTLAKMISGSASGPTASFLNASIMPSLAAPS